MGTLTRRELPGAGDSLAQLHDRQARRESASIVDGLASVAVRSGNPVQEPRKANNAVLLLNGAHVGFKLEKDGTRVDGQPGSSVGKQSSFSASATVTGVQFVRANAQDALAVLSATADVTFINCQFVRSTEDAADWVQIAAGGKARFIGCSFIGIAAGGTVVNNAGAAGNVGIIGCSNKTGRPHANVTVVFETT